MTIANTKCLAMVAAVALIALCRTSVAQEAEVAAGPAPVPHVVQFTGTVPTSASTAGSTQVEARFALYSASSSGEPLWQEKQTLAPDAKGRYSVLLGAATPGGLPQGVFSSAAARWLGVRIGDQPELPRTLLVAAPYSLKASDSETVGGHPATDFLLAPRNSDGTPEAGTAITQINTSSGILGGGTGPTVSLSLDPTYFQELASNFAIKGTANGFRGEQTLLPTGSATSSTAFNSYPLEFSGSAFNSSAGAAQNINFLWQAEPSGNDTTAPFGSIKLLYASGANTPAETGFGVGSNGQISFARGQTFPGTGTGDGTITGVTAGTGLTGGGTTGTISLALNSTYLAANYAALGAADTYSAPQTINSTEVISGSASPQLSVATTNAFGEAIEAQGVAGTGIGVYATGGTALYGVGATGTHSVSNTTTGTGVVASGGSAQGGYGVNAFGFTAVNANGSTTGPASQLTGDGTGVNASGYIGVVGQGANTAQANYLAGTGVYASGYNGIVSYGNGSTGFGVYASGATGVSANSSTAGGNALTATFTGNSNTSGYAVNAASTNGRGVQASGTQFGSYSVSSAGTAGTAGAKGVEINESSTGSNLVVRSGLWGDTGQTTVLILGGTSTVYSALLGTADNSYAALLQNTSILPALQVTNTETSASAIVANFNGATGDCNITNGGNLACNGSITQVVRAGEGEVHAYSVTSASPWMEDAGSGRLSSGAALVQLDAVFASTVNAAVEYHVFLTPKDECEGLYVTNETPTSFEVHESHHGSSNVAFDYRIMARRAGHEKDRLAAVTPEEKRAVLPPAIAGRR